MPVRCPHSTSRIESARKGSTVTVKEKNVRLGGERPQGILRRKIEIEDAVALENRQEPTETIGQQKTLGLTRNRKPMNVESIWRNGMCERRRLARPISQYVGEARRRSCHNDAYDA